MSGADTVTVNRADLERAREALDRVIEQRGVDALVERLMGARQFQAAQAADTAALDRITASLATAPASAALAAVTAAHRPGCGCTLCRQCRAAATEAGA